METEHPRVDPIPPGDPARHAALEQLEKGLASLEPAPRDHGRVALLVRRVAGGVREQPARLRLTPEAGVPEDAWGRGENPRLEAQISVMEIDVANLIANGQPVTLFGDNLFLSLDLSVENLPPGSRVRVGTATMEVTPKAHNGCRKFHARFGSDALRFVSKPDLRHRNFRGIYMRVVEGGDVAPGDLVTVIARGPTPS
jgi:MOSC domain-containing protein